MVSTDKKNNLENTVIHDLKAILGEENVLTSIEDRYCYAYDATATGNDTYLPDIVVLPSTTEQVSKILKIANENNIPVLARGAGTNLSGGCIPLKGGIIIHFSKMNNI